MENHGAELAEGMDELWRESAHVFYPLNLGVKRGCGLKGEISRGLIALGAERNKTALATRREKALDGGGFFFIALVSAALEAGRETHFHFGINAAGKAGIG